MDGMSTALLLLLAGVVGIFSMRVCASVQEASGLLDAPKSSQALPLNGVPDARGIYRVGGAVQAPVLVYRVDPEYTNRARKKKVSAGIQVDLIVDAKGVPQNVVVVRTVGFGLDEAAVKALKQYRFKPALREGVAVPVYLSVEVTFHIF